MSTLDGVARFQAAKDFVGAAPQQLRGDEVFDSLVVTLKLPNVKGVQKKADGDFRFPPRR